MNLTITGRKRGFWLIKPTLFLYRLGLRRLAFALAERYVSVDVYCEGHFLLRVGLERKADAA